MRILGVVLLVVGCGSVDEKPIDARPADMQMSTPDTPGIDMPAATCVASPAGLRVRYRAENNANDHGGAFAGVQVGANFGYTPGKFGSAFLFDGSDDLVTVNDGDQLWPSGALTIEAWVKTTTTVNGNVVAKYACGNVCAANNGSLAYFALYVSAAGKAIFEFRPDAVTTENVTSVTSPASVNDGTWHHLVGVRDATATNALIYVDGALGATVSASAAQFGPMTNVDGDVDLVTLGSSVRPGMTTYSGYLSGAVDEVAIYHTALSAAQISAIYAAPEGKCL
jgi:hypothetical protein